MTTCEQARQDLSSRGLRGSCRCARLDLEDFASVRSFAKAEKAALAAAKRPQGLSVLVNNAGRC